MFGEESVIGEHDSDWAFEAAFEPDDVGFSAFGGYFGSVGSGDSEKFEHRGLLECLFEDLVYCLAGGLDYPWFCGRYAWVDVAAFGEERPGDRGVPSSTTVLELTTEVQPSEVCDFASSGNDHNGVPLGYGPDVALGSSGAFGNSGSDVGNNDGGDSRLEIVTKNRDEVRMKFPKILPNLAQILNVDASRVGH
jgi:hypothetical protein